MVKMLPAHGIIETSHRRAASVETLTKGNTHDVGIGLISPSKPICPQKPDLRYTPVSRQRWSGFRLNCLRRELSSGHFAVALHDGGTFLGSDHNGSLS